MADERTCRRCGFVIRDDEELLTCGEEYEHFCTADCIERLRADNERLQTAIDTLRQNVTTNAGNRSEAFAYVWQSVWDEFERRVTSEPTTKETG